MIRLPVFAFAGEHLAPRTVTCPSPAIALFSDENLARQALPHLRDCASLRVLPLLAAGDLCAYLRRAPGNVLVYLDPLPVWGCRGQFYERHAGGHGRWRIETLIAALSGE